MFFGFFFFTAMPNWKSKTQFKSLLGCTFWRKFLQLEFDFLHAKIPLGNICFHFFFPTYGLNNRLGFIALVGNHFRDGDSIKSPISHWTTRVDKLAPENAQWLKFFSSMSCAFYHRRTKYKNLYNKEEM